jgi:AcrR family transcriptional regulator
LCGCDAADAIQVSGEKICKFQFAPYHCRVISQFNIEKTDRILSTALKLFVTYGFHGTPTSKIASEAGISNGTLFHYFKTKDELFINTKRQDYYNEEFDLLLEDMHDENVIAKEGLLFFIDTVFYIMEGKMDDSIDIIAF